ncbi:MAG: GGDEF domain-containing protein [Firmicutes bacterium]|nr:GGDEF domain-containing protein [Bacillota bacterium]
MASLFEVIMPSRVMLFVAPAFFYQMAFFFGGNILNGAKISFKYAAPLFASINAGLLLAVSYNLSVPASMLTMTMIPVIIVLELAIITRDKLLPYLHIYFSGVLTLLCSHSFAGAIVNIWWNDTWSSGSQEHRYCLFALTMIIGGLVYTGLLFSQFTPAAVLSELMHSRSRGALLFVYFIVSDIVLLFSSQSVQAFMYDSSVPIDIEVAMYMDTAMKDGLILFCSFLIVMVQIWQEQQLHKQKETELRLETEREFRASRQKGSLMQYCANVSRDVVVEGREIFSDLQEDGSGYTAAIGKFALECVHPEDLPYLIVGNELSFYEAKILTDPNYSIRFRIAPSRVMDTTDIWHMFGGGGTAEKEWIWVEFQITLVRDQVSQDILAYVSLGNIDEEMTEKVNLRQAARTDGLTGLLNRARLDQRIEDHLEDGDNGGALFLIDMDHFKSVNDLLGHPAGDALLKEMAAIFKQRFRDSDLVGRLGGDEFCVFAPGLHNSERILVIAQSLNEQGRKLHTDKTGAQFTTSLSIGIAVSPDHGSTLGELYQCADIALYQAKEAGRDTFRIYSPDMETPETPS